MRPIIMALVVYFLFVYQLGSAAANVAITPTILDFGVIPANTVSDPETVTFLNVGQTPVVVSTIQFTGTNSVDFGILNDNCSRQTIPPAGQCTVNGVFAPLSDGEKIANLTITSNDPTTPQVHVQFIGGRTLPPVTETPLLGVVPGVFTTTGGPFEVTVSPRDANGEFITGHFSTSNFAFRNMYAVPDLNPNVTFPAVATEVTDVETLDEESGLPVRLVWDFDSSGSMNMNDPNRLRVQAGKDFLPLITPQDLVAVFDFGAGATPPYRASRLLQGFTSDPALLSVAFDKVTQDNGTPLYDSLLDALGLFPSSTTHRPRLVVLTDGEDNQSVSLPAEVISVANQKGIPLFTIGLGSELDFTVLQDMAGQTNGSFAEVANATALESVFELLSRGILEGRVIVKGMGRFDPPLQAGAYRIFGVLVTTSSGSSVDTPFNFPVDIVPVAAATNRTFQRSTVPYTAEEESLLGK
jgi:Ca-activated chloride channel homolog